MTCLCNHLTFFTLISINNKNTISQDIVGTLDTMSIIGCYFSIAGFSVIIATFILFKDWRKTMGNQILFCLSIANFAALVVLTTGIHQTQSKFVCRTIAVLLHYSILCSFTWMIVEAFYQNRQFGKVRMERFSEKFIWKVSIFACGSPLLPIIVILLYDSSHYAYGIDIPLNL